MEITKQKWDTMMNRLQEFQNKNGHTKVKKADDPELFEWMKYIRNTYRHQIIYKHPDSNRWAKQKYLSESKQKQLEEIGFEWKTRTVRKWETMIRQLEEFKEKNGHTTVTEEEEPLLFEWTRSLRYNYGHQIESRNNGNPNPNPNRPNLSEAKLQKLEELGFNWEKTRKIKKWDIMFPKLQRFHKEHGHTMVSPTDDYELSQWVKSIRANYRHQTLDTGKDTKSKSTRRASLSKEKLQSLKKVGFCWDVHAAKWQMNYMELCNFQKIYGHCRVSVSEDRKLSTFIQNQRQQYRRYLAGKSTSMTPERIKSLSKINFEWPQAQTTPRQRSRAVTWDDRFAELKDYWEKYGHTNVSQDCEDHFELGQWCMNQRTNYRMYQQDMPTNLTPERIQKLEKLDFAWSIRHMRWKVMFQRLKSFQEEHGHLEIPVSDSDNSDLRQWLNEQRYFYRTNATSRLNEERIESMESIPEFSWRRKGEGGPSKDDWSQLFVAIREKGIAPGGKLKEHWFDGAERFSTKVKTEWTEQELLALWNEENEEDEDDNDEYFEDTKG